jgi:hypothetical protein
VGNGGVLNRCVVLTGICAQGTNKRTQQQLELEIENMGGHLNAYTSVFGLVSTNYLQQH